VGQDGILRADWQSAQTRTARIFTASGHSIFVPDFHARHLPHYHAIGQPIFLTWRLHGSLPANRSFPSAITSGQAFVAMDRLLDNARTGPLYLRQPELAAMVVEAIRYRHDLEHYQLHAYVVMANHVHLLITPHVEVSRLMQSLKRFTAREGNRMLGLTGQPFWQDESYDRLVRDDTEFQRIVRYIEMNPVKAGLAANPEDFPWSSAGPITNRPAGYQPALQDGTISGEFSLG
jgi:REP element-mobilizing transposase RayT